MRQCLASEPGPWYPRDYVETAKIDRESVYGPLNDLRLANLVQLTEWVQGKGQGYAITPLGKEVLTDPLFLQQLRDGAPRKPATPTKSETARTAGATRFEIGEAARRTIFEPQRSIATPILVIANVAIFIGSFALAVRAGVPVSKFLGGGDVIAMHKAGAVSADDLARGEWWRLVTNCFLHFGMLHLTLNMFSLVLLRRVESLWGTGRYVVLYLTCGLCGSIAGVFVHPGELTRPIYLAGASGALWGVMASEVVWLVLNRSHLPASEVRRITQQLFFTLLLNVGVSMLPNVSAAAHFGGGLAGAISAVLLQAHRYGTARRRSLAGLGLALVPTIFLLGLAFAFDQDKRLQPYMTNVYREQVEQKVGKLPAALADLEHRADRLNIQESTKRDASELEKVRNALYALAKQAKDTGEWASKSTAPSAGGPVKERTQEMLAALTAFAEGLEKHAGGTPVPNLNELRKNWQDAFAAWNKATSKPA